MRRRPVTHHARAFWVRSPGRGEIRAEPLPDPGPDEVLVRTRYTGVSRGTETLVFQGRVPADQYAAMRAPFQEGDFPGPVKYGYLNVGVVEAGPPELLGRTVFCLYPHQTGYVVPASAVVPVRRPGGGTAAGRRVPLRPADHPRQPGGYRLPGPPRQPHLRRPSHARARPARGSPVRRAHHRYVAVRRAARRARPTRCGEPPRALPPHHVRRVTLFAATVRD